mmetsp:Transcript_35372/g.80355  ORF Transcript_35372/g.80355 Transcript_35372/m.80355 type:complete len:489 (-) Transcript_35372:42-1508(-)
MTGRDRQTRGSRSLGEALREAAGELLTVQVLADEDHLAAALLALGPGALLRVGEEHVDGLEDELLLHALHREHALGAEEVHALLPEQPADPLVQLLLDHLTRDVDAHGADALVVLVVVAVLQEGVVHGDDLVQGEAADAHDEVHVHFAVRGALDGHARVDGADAPLHLLQLLLRVHEVALVQEDAVGEGHLLDGLVLHALGLLVVEVLDDVLGVHEREDAVEAVVLLDVVVREEGLGHGRGVREARGLDHDAVQRLARLLGVLHELLEPRDEVAAHGAADAAVVHLHDVLLVRHGATLHQRVVDAHLPELVLDDRDALAVVLLKDVVQQGRLAAAEEARQHRDRDLAVAPRRRRRAHAGLQLGPLLGGAVVAPVERGRALVLEDGPLRGPKPGEEVAADLEHGAHGGLLLGRRLGPDALEEGLGLLQDLRVGAPELRLQEFHATVDLLHAVEVLALGGQGLGLGEQLAPGRHRGSVFLAEAGPRGEAE